MVSKSYSEVGTRFFVSWRVITICDFQKDLVNGWVSMRLSLYSPPHHNYHGFAFFAITLFLRVCALALLFLLLFNCAKKAKSAHFCICLSTRKENKVHKLVIAFNYKTLDGAFESKLVICRSSLITEPVNNQIFLRSY